MIITENHLTILLAAILGLGLCGIALNLYLARLIKKKHDTQSK